MMRRSQALTALALILGCNAPRIAAESTAASRDPRDAATISNPADAAALAADVRAETLRAWAAYRKYAWPHDELLPITRTYRDFYGESISIAPVDAYSTLKVMGFDDEAKRIESFVVNDLSFRKNSFVKVFEVNIRILGGLLCVYELSGNADVLGKARDIGDRLLPAFRSPTGLPYRFVNLETGATKEKVVNVAEAGSYLFEFGILSYYTGDPKYYQAAKRASLEINSLRSKLGLLGRDLDVETGQWTMTQSMVGAYADSYFEYLYKSWMLFHDPDIKRVWDDSIAAIQKYIAEPHGELLWYGKVDMNTGRKVNAEVTLWDAFFPGLLALSGDIGRAKAGQAAWDRLWDMHGLIPMVYDYDKGQILNPYYQLNPELIESTYYLWHFTKDPRYLAMVSKYYADIKRYCRNETAYCHIEDVTTMKKADEMETFFIAETMKYCYLTFQRDCPVNADDYVFSTEAHPFKKSHFNGAAIARGLQVN
jgi:Glycosyl hydrolase family 47